MKCHYCEAAATSACDYVLDTRKRTGDGDFSERCRKPLCGRHRSSGSQDEYGTCPDHAHPAPCRSEREP